MPNKEWVIENLNKIKSEYGEWSFDIPLPFDIWTAGNKQYPHKPLRRAVQIVADISRKPLSECRILDLGCLDGIFSVEFAQQGATVVGVDVRKTNIEKAKFCKEALELANLEFYHDDVRNISLESHGKFEAIICNGLLYHLLAHDAINLIKTMYEMTNRVVVIDTHVSLVQEEKIAYGDNEYWGHTWREYPDDTPKDVIEKATWSSADNPTSFWFTRPSLVNILTEAGFSTVYECFTPFHLHPVKPGLERSERCTFVAIKDEVRQIKTSPAVNSLDESWPEKSLSYHYVPVIPAQPPSTEQKKPQKRTFLSRVLSRISRMLKNSF